MEKTEVINGRRHPPFYWQQTVLVLTVASPPNGRLMASIPGAEARHDALIIWAL